MSRRRFRATPAPPRATGFNIGVTMQATGTTTRRPQAETEAAPSTITGPFMIPLEASAYSCTWLVHIQGVAPDDVIEWAATWNDMVGFPAGAGFDELVDPGEPVQMFHSYVGYLTGITLYATVNGETYTLETPVECAI